MSVPRTYPVTNNVTRNMYYSILLQLQLKGRLTTALQYCYIRVSLFLYDIRFCSSGETERVEMVLENVVIEISKHRDVGTVYLTNYRYC